MVFSEWQPLVNTAINILVCKVAAHLMTGCLIKQFEASVCFAFIVCRVIVCLCNDFPLFYLGEILIQYLKIYKSKYITDTYVRALTVSGGFSDIFILKNQHKACFTMTIQRRTQLYRLRKPSQNLVTQCYAIHPIAPF
jgi:hypothetical protein